MRAKRLEKLRALMSRETLDGFVVPQTDAFMGEYIPECAQRLRWISGFNGSAGAAIILKDSAVAMTDSRYTIQIQKEVDSALYDIGSSQDTSIGQWLSDNTNQGDVIAYDPWLHTHAEISAWEKFGICLKAVPENLIDCIWDDRPNAPSQPVFLHDDTIVGRSAHEKKALVADQLKAHELDAFVLSDPQSIAWVLNVRSSDVSCTPLPLSYAIIHQDASVDWFIDEARLLEDVVPYLGQSVRVHAPDALAKELAQLSEVERVGLDFKRAPIAFFNALDDGTCEIINSKDPCIDIRAQKTPQEIESMKAAHIRDGRALTKALKWIEDEAPKGTLTEMIVDQKLNACRAETGALEDLSFPAIVGWAENGAIVHYRVSDESSLPIKGQGLLLIDSGGQYVEGTTDVTRTVALNGAPTQAQKHAFTLVLKGHIAVATAVFPERTTGAQIDLLARKALWEEGLDYGHGTGHGVGCYLSVHEEATSISPRCNDPFKVGMIISNEPGYYKAGEFGIRIESLLVVIDTGKTLEDGRPLLGFETITMVPLDEKLIEWSMLSDSEARWVRDYQELVRQTLDL